jgi:hypothetical protein
MKESTYRIVSLPTEIAASARQAAAAGAPDHARMTVETAESFPCRHCLRWAAPGEEVVLFPYASIPAGRPYAESGPISVHQKDCPRYAQAATYPADFRGGRVLRVYNRRDEIIDAEVVGERDPETVIEMLLRNPEAAFVQARSADRGCYTFTVARA